MSGLGELGIDSSVWSYGDQRTPTWSALTVRTRLLTVLLA